MTTIKVSDAAILADTASAGLILATSDSVDVGDFVLGLNVTDFADAYLHYAQELIGGRQNHPISRKSPYYGQAVVEIGDFGLVLNNTPVLSYQLEDNYYEGNDLPYKIKPFYVGEEPGNAVWDLKSPDTPEIFDDTAYDTMPLGITNDSFMMWMSSGSPFFWISVKDKVFSSESFLTLFFILDIEYGGSEENINVRDRWFLSKVPESNIYPIGISNAIAACRSSNYQYVVSRNTIVKSDYLQEGNPLQTFSIDDIGTLNGIMMRPNEDFFYVSTNLGMIYKYEMTTNGNLETSVKREQYQSVFKSSGIPLKNIHRDSNGNYYYEVGFDPVMGLAVKAGYDLIVNWKLSTIRKRGGSAYFYAEFDDDWLFNEYLERFQHRLSLCETADWEIRTGSNWMKVIAHFELSTLHKAIKERDLVFGTMADKIGWKQIGLAHPQTQYFTDRMLQSVELGVNFANCISRRIVAIAFTTDGDTYFEVNANGRVEKLFPFSNWHLWPAYHKFSYYFGVDDPVDAFCDDYSFYIVTNEDTYEIPFDKLNGYIIWDEKIEISDSSWKIESNVPPARCLTTVEEDILVDTRLDIYV